jgi:hypothetical protein
MARETEVEAAAELVPGVVRGAGRTQWETRTVSCCVTRRCRHLGADLANGSVDREGCLGCPWRQTRRGRGADDAGPQGFFAKIPGSDAGYRLLTRVLPLGRGVLVEREGTVFVR